MIELIKYVISQFAEYQDDIEYIINEKEDSIDFIAVLNESDMGKVIGKQGKIAKALRTLVRAGTKRGEKRIDIEIKSKNENK